VRKDAFLSQLLASRGFETQSDAQKNAAFVLKSGIVTDPVDNLASPVTRKDALRWAIQSLGLSEEAKILADVNLASVGLHFQDAASLSPFERGCLIVAACMRPPIFNADAANFRGAQNISQDEAKTVLANVRSAARLMRLELKFSPAPGMELEIFREGTFSDIPKWRVYVDGFDEKSEVDAMQKFFASQGFKMEPGNPNYEWRLASELFDDYARVRRLTAIAANHGKSARVLSSLKNTNLENQPFYWALLTISPGSYLMEPIIAPAGVTTLAPLSMMVRGSEASAAINAGFFGVSGRNRGAPIGTLRINNTMLNKPYQGRTCLGWSRDNRAAFGEVTWDGNSLNNDDPHWNSMDNIIQAGPFLIRNREIDIEPEGFSASILNLRHPRSVMGLTEEGKWFFFVGDGRDGMHSAGFTLQEVAVILKRKGAAYALNLDGGGSSQLMIGNKIFNSPSEKKERPVSYGVGAKRK
jgi:exopolysaccharide biosynthesis protein